MLYLNMETENPALEAVYVKKRTLVSAIFATALFLISVVIFNIKEINPPGILFSSIFLFITIRAWRAYFNSKQQLVINEIGILIDGKPLIKWGAIEHCYFKKNDEEDDDALVIKAIGIKRNQAVWLSFLDKSRTEVEDIINHYAGVHGFSTITPPKKWWQ
jgi:hypothetical protein